MPILHLAILALVQGITEFLPISSSGHLVLVPFVMDWQDQGPLLDVAVHVGTLLAVMLYAWREIGLMLAGLWRLVRGRIDQGARLMLQVILASIPVVIAGYAVAKYAGGMFRSIEVIGWTTLGFGILLGLADRAGMTVRRLEHMSYGSALVIGLSQALALIPGTSRSGITMTFARLLGFERADAARFSLLLAIPAIAGAGTLSGIELWQSGDMTLTRDAFTAAGLAFVSALVAILLMMAWLRRAGFLPFVVYRILLGGILLYLVYAG
ncbi:undecaprenyl-diphosphate phosphatase [Nisaea acidiphila]|uniref:Undecaprenyl-diphosphatase n=1 Tax=Nisaea acidiphila TaxID=1862145 RepID=A0A9J7AWS5_9PROT|nr:undecaprenyl-diphosphate phosphatase [Nisaea acidiphila]UUX51744.1 undecaprenyl-diphosphate phosphatase [Nisaea acidiphila]